MLIKNIELEGTICDLRLEGGVIKAIGRFDTNKVTEPVIEGRGGAAMPGLHDHHIHINALAAARMSVKCGPPEIFSPPALLEALTRERETAPATGLRGVGYHESVAGEIDRAWLDKYFPDIPVKIQHRSGRLWIMNSKMMAYYGVQIPADGRFFDFDADLRRESEFPCLKPTIDYLLAQGITGVTEVTPSNDIAEFEHYKKALLPLRHIIMGRSSLSGRSDEALGALKLHYHEADLPSLADLVAQIKAAHEAGRPVASHCVTRAEIMLTLAAIEEARPLLGDRIEHAAITDMQIIAWIKRLGVTVVSQPSFITERAAAYRANISEGERKNLWRLGSFVREGLKLAVSSDAPFGNPDPWKVMAAAVNRPCDFNPGEAVSPEVVLGLYTKPATDAGASSRKLEVGALADLCILEQSWATARQALDRVKVIMTVINGEIVYATNSSTNPHDRAV